MYAGFGMFLNPSLHQLSGCVLNQEVVLITLIHLQSSDVIFNRHMESKICFVLKFTKVKVKSSMARSLPVENLLPHNVGSIINYLQYLLK